MGKQKSDDEIAQIAKQAQEEFDLEAELNGQSRLTKTVRVYLDQVAGQDLGGVEVIETIGEFGIPKQTVHAWGLVEKLNNLTATPEDEKKNAKEIRALKEQAKVLQARLEASALDIEMTWVPVLLKDGATRAAREALGIHEKVTPNHLRYDEFVKEHDAQILERIVLSVTKVATDAKNKGLTIKGARALRGKLPDWEWAKVNEGIGELLFENHISSKAIENPDF